MIALRRVWRYQRSHQKPYIEERHNVQKKKYKRSNKTYT